MTIPHEIKILIYDASIKNKIDFRFLLALVKTESEFNPKAERFEPGYPFLYSVKELSESLGCNRATMTCMQRRSYGICQIMGAVAYELGFRGWASDLHDPEKNLYYACKHIANLCLRFSISSKKDYETLYAAYNSGSLRKTYDNVWVNQRNVTRFLKQYDMIQIDESILLSPMIHPE